jgi:hypothetical protein
MVAGADTPLGPASPVTDGRASAAGSTPAIRFHDQVSDGTDSFGLIVGLGRGDRAWPELAGQFEQPAAQVLQECRPSEVMLTPRQPAEARSRTAQTRWGTVRAASLLGRCPPAAGPFPARRRLRTCWSGRRPEVGPVLLPPGRSRVSAWMPRSPTRGGPDHRSWYGPRDLTGACPQALPTWLAATRNATS